MLGYEIFLDGTYLEIFLEFSYRDFSISLDFKIVCVQNNRDSIDFEPRQHLNKPVSSSQAENFSSGYVRLGQVRMFTAQDAVKHTNFVTRISVVHSTEHEVYLSFQLKPPPCGAFVVAKPTLFTSQQTKAIQSEAIISKCQPLLI